ncbi:MAG: pyridoxal phosphate-dependent aminotransferase [Myxococcota bacterium]
MSAAGQSVISLTAGEPDFPTPIHIADALKTSVDSGNTRYTAVSGTPELRAAIRGKYASRGFDYPVDQIIASTGAKQALYNALMASVNEGQEVVFAAPYWLSYADMVRLAQGVPKIIETTEDQNFLMTAEQLRGALGPNTRAVIINSPSNPTGAVYGPEEFKALAEVLLEFPDVLIIADEIYEHLIYGGQKFTSILDADPRLMNQTLIVSGCSKSYAMTGLRLGWAAGPKPLIAAMAKLQGQCTSNPSAPIQDAAIAAITGSHKPVEEMLAAFNDRRQKFVTGLNALPGVTCFDPKGAFYAFANVSSYQGRTLPNGPTINDASDICSYLLDSVGVVVVPGAPFGAPQYFRASFATDQDSLDEGLKRIAEALGKIK